MPLKWESRAIPTTWSATVVPGPACIRISRPIASSDPNSRRANARAEELARRALTETPKGNREPVLVPDVLCDAAEKQAQSRVRVFG